jgi:hypothetical protein
VGDWGAAKAVGTAQRVKARKRRSHFRRLFSFGNEQIRTDPLQLPILRGVVVSGSIVVVIETSPDFCLCLPGLVVGRPRPKVEAALAAIPIVVVRRTHRHEVVRGGGARSAPIA